MTWSTSKAANAHLVLRRTFVCPFIMLGVRLIVVIVSKRMLGPGAASQALQLTTLPLSAGKKRHRGLWKDLWRVLFKGLTSTAVGLS